MKKILAKFLVVMFCLSLILGANTLVVNAANTYNATAAVSYAANHWNDGVGACATFVSNCLKAGGCTASSSLVSTLRNSLINGGWGIEYTLTRNGAYTYQSQNIGKLSAGDPIFFYCKTCSKWQHVVICSGFDASGRAKAYAHNVAWNDKTFATFIDENGHTGDAIIYYSVHMYQTPTNNVSFTSRDSENTKSDNNAIVHCYLNKPSGSAITKIGIKVRKDSSTYDAGWSHYQAPSNGNYNSWTAVPIFWDFKSEVGFTPTHATKYYYKFYAVVGGKEYWSDEYNITTTGSHSFGAWSTTKSATCTSAGAKKRTCACGLTETSNIAATGHNWASSFTVDKEANCKSEGSKSRHCLSCSAKTDVTVIPTTRIHSVDDIEPVSDATCTESAKDKWTCNVCGYEAIVSDPDNRPALGHAYSNNCDKSCNVCGATRTVGAHKYSSSCDTTCDYCNAKRTIKHTYNNSCDTSCNVCKVTRTITHTYSNNCDKSCNVCGKTRTVGAHKYSNSCDTTCNYCNAKRTIKHTYSNSCDTTCNVCKAKRTIKHTYSNNCDTSCNVCKATRTITHSYKTTTTKATLTKNGSVIKKCTVCGKVASNTAIKYAKTFKLSTTSYTYNGKTKTPSVTVKDSAGKTLKKNTDYTVTYASGRKNAGTYKVTIKMIGNYTGTKTLTFKIKPAKLSSFKLSDTSYTYNGKAKTPSVTVKNANGTKMTKNKHYTVTYSSGRKNVGTYEVTIKGKGNYTGTKTLTFKIIPKAASVNTLTAGSKKLTVKLNRSLKQSTGYQIQYSTNKTFKKAKTKTVTSYKIGSTTLTGLKAKTTYYVRIRTYKTVGKTKYYSNWSSYKYKKTK